MWNAIIGHSSQLQQLQRAAQSGTLAQAYLFAGPKGVGKALVARTMAASVVREEERVMREQHPDVIWLRVLPEKSEISMEQWRAVEAKVQFRALEGERKFIIIDDADRMSASVANACLKTLEEPPVFTHFILIAHDSDRLLPTIRSRCQQIVFGSLPQSAVTKWMAGQGVDAATAARAAALAQGSFQRAQKLAAPEVLAQLDVVTRDVKQGVTPQQVVVHAATLAANEALPELLDGLAFSLREQLLQQVSPRVLQRLRAVEQASQFVSMKGANKELILNELFISLSA